ncbi:MAG: metallophosphoesterase, partial [Candidatus Paceibacterota bacterium]
MPKVGIFSDLHMEFNTERNGIPWDFEPEPDAFYICAGDIHSNDEKREAFINKHAKHMFWVLGNHDYYGGKFPSGYQNCMAYVDKNTGLSIKGDTLWTNLTQDRDWVLYQNDLVDSRLIR